MTGRDMALAALVAVIWGLGFVAIKIGLESFSPPQLTALRFLVAAVGVVVLRRPQISWSMLILIGLTLFTGQFLLLFFAYAAGLPPGVASVTQQMQAFFTVMLAAVFLDDVPGLRQSIGMLVAFCGLALIGLTVGGDLTALGLGLAMRYWFPRSIRSRSRSLPRPRRHRGRALSQSFILARSRACSPMRCGVIFWRAIRPRRWCRLRCLRRASASCPPRSPLARFLPRSAMSGWRLFSLVWPWFYCPTKCARQSRSRAKKQGEKYLSRLPAILRVIRGHSVANKPYF